MVQKGQCVPVQVEEVAAIWACVRDALKLKRLHRCVDSRPLLRCQPQPVRHPLAMPNASCRLSVSKCLPPSVLRLVGLIQRVLQRCTVSQARHQIQPQRFSVLVLWPCAAEGGVPLEEGAIARVRSMAGSCDLCPPIVHLHANTFAVVCLT